MARIVQPDTQGIAAAAETLRAGGLVAVPTETVYGLAADATDARAVGRIFAAKGRPPTNPLIAHVPTIEAAREIGRFDAAAESLAAAFWPGPLTLVVPRTETCRICPEATAGLATVAIRLPAHGVMQAVLRQTGRPLAAPSANRSGHVSATDARHVADDLGDRVDLILDGGPSAIGIESTIVLCADDRLRLLRPGGIAPDALARAAGRPLEGRPDETTLHAPGMMESHYAPRAGLRLAASNVRAGEALLGFGRVPLAGTESAAATLNLSPSGDLAEAASNLFAYLRRLDATGAATIAVAPIPATGMGIAINDRLARAAAPRPEPTP